MRSVTDDTIKMYIFLFNFQKIWIQLGYKKLNLVKNEKTAPNDANCTRGTHFWVLSTELCDRKVN